MSDPTCRGEALDALDEIIETAVFAKVHIRDGGPEFTRHIMDCLDEINGNLHKVLDWAQEGHLHDHDDSPPAEDEQTDGEEWKRGGG